MGSADENELDAFLHRDGLIPELSAEAVAKSLDGFPLKLQNGRDMDWLAMATRRALGVTMGNVEDGPDRTSNAEIRSALERLAGITQSAWSELFECDQAAEGRLFDYAWRNWDGEGGTDIGDGILMGEPSMHVRFRAAIQELEWLAVFLSDAARETESQRGPWRQSASKRLRIERAQYLAPIFEAAYGEAVSANNWRADGWRGDAFHTHKTPFMDYYQRMVSVAYGEHATPDLSGVLKAACKLHRKQPARFADGLIPRL